MNRLEQLKAFRESEPDDAFLNYAIAMEFVGQKKYVEAEKLLERLKVIHPSYTALYYHLGKLYQRRGDLELAESIYREGIMLTTKAREQQQLAELQSALNNMLYDE